MENQGLWKAREAEVAESGGCVVCLRFQGHTTNLCSVCADFVRTLQKPWEVVMGEFSPAELFQALGHDERERQRRAAADSARTLATLDRVAHTIAVPPPMFEHLKRNLRTCEVSPPLLARQLLDIGRPLITSLQAGELLALLRGRGEADYRYFHVACSRVVDPWNLSSEHHGIGHCYYGYADTDASVASAVAPLIGDSDCETLAAVYWGIVRRRVTVVEASSWSWSLAGPFEREHFWDDGMLNFIQDDMREHTVDVAVDVVITCQYREDGPEGSMQPETGSVTCTTAAGELLGSFPVPEGQEPLGPWLCEAVNAAKAAGGGLRGRLCLVTPDGDIIWRGSAPSPFEEVCRHGISRGSHPASNRSCRKAAALAAALLLGRPQHRP